MARQIVISLFALMLIAMFPCFGADGTAEAEQAVSVSAGAVSSGGPGVEWAVAVDGDRMGESSVDKLKVEITDAKGRTLVSEWHPVEPPIRKGKGATVRGTTRIPALYAQQDKLCKVTLYGRGGSLSGVGAVGGRVGEPRLAARNERAEGETYIYEQTSPKLATPPREIQRREVSSEPDVNSRIYISNHGVGLATSVEWQTSPQVRWGIGYGAPVYWWDRHRRYPHGYWPYGRVGWSRRHHSRWGPHFGSGLSIIWHIGD